MLRSILLIVDGQVGFTGGAARLEHAEVFPLALFALLGMMVFATANDLLTLFVALEVLSLPLYVMCGLARRRRLLSQEAALKYFLLGAFASAFFAYGIALAYGFAGGVRLADIDRAVAAGADNRALLLAAIGLMSVGLLFKIGAVPFHAWVPDAYRSASPVVAGFLASVSKAATLGALLVLLYLLGRWYGEARLRRVLTRVPRESRCQASRR